MENKRSGFRNGQLIYPMSYPPTIQSEEGGSSGGGGGYTPSEANNDGVINTDKEVHDFLEGYPEGTKLKDTIGDTLTDEEILDTFGFNPGDVDLNPEE